MKRATLTIAGFILTFCFGFYVKAVLIEKSENNKQPNNSNNMKKVTGIGGIFFKCKDPNKIKEWYKTHLGIDAGSYGASFEWQESTDPSKKGTTQWNPFPETTKYFDPSAKDVMINYRVENLTALVEELKKEGVTILDKIETYDFGKFVHIMDIEGNKIELWEPVYDEDKTGEK
jgi:predicted enzyme related to lactoylglutathione lyase